MVNAMRNLLCLVLGLFFISLNVSAASLWLNTSTGMTMKDVQQVFPMLSKSSVSSAILNNKSVQQLHLDNIRIDDNTFTAIFSFLDNKLIQVTLEMDPVSLSATNVAFGTLMDDLRKKYGKEKDYSEKLGLIMQRQARWLHEGTNVQLSMESFSSENANLRLVYF